jgi:hypothetical protein
MAKTTVVTMTDDLDGGKAEGTVVFSVGGTNYEIDLSKKNAAALDKALAPYVAAARKVRDDGSTRRRVSASNGRRTSASRGNAEVSAVREWAKTNGYEVSERGRLSGAILDAYHAAN